MRKVIIWILLLLGVVRTTILIRQRDTSEFASVDGSAVLGVAIVGALAAVFLCSPRSTRRVINSLRLGAPRLLMTYYLLAIASTAWSVVPNYTAFRAMEVALVTLAAFFVMACYRDFAFAERDMLRFLFVVTVLSFLYKGRATGFTIAGLHTNQFTVPAGMGAVYAFGESFQAVAGRKRALRRWMWVFLAFLTVGTSVGSNLGAAAGFLGVLFLHGTSRLLIIPAIAAVVALLSLSGEIETLLRSTVFSGRSTSELATMTGRDRLWTGYYNGFLERPWTGYGFAVASRVGSMFGILATTNTHNGFIEAALGTGLGGMVVFLTWWFRHIKDLLAAWRKRIPGSLGLTGAFIMLAVNNNSKSILGGGYDPTLAAAVITIAFFHCMVFLPSRSQRRSPALLPSSLPDRVAMNR